MVSKLFCNGRRRDDEDTKGNKSKKTKTSWKKSESLTLQDSIVEPPKVGPKHAGNYHNVLSENNYWSTAEDMQVPIFSKTRGRDNFRTIKCYFHVADNQKLENSEIAKVSWLSSKLTRHLQQFGVFHELLSVDEAMVPYNGHHSVKIFIKNKPVRFGFKILMLCGSDGYPYNMEIYCGRSADNNKEPLGTRVVKNMLSVVETPSQHVGKSVTTLLLNDDEVVIADKENSEKKPSNDPQCQASKADLNDSSCGEIHDNEVLEHIREEDKDQAESSKEDILFETAQDNENLDRIGFEISVTKSMEEVNSSLSDSDGDDFDATVNDIKLTTVTEECDPATETEFVIMLPQNIRCGSCTLNLIATSDCMKAISFNVGVRTKHMHAIDKCCKLGAKAGWPGTPEV
ncbi:hypothetical protein ILUMI_02677 [Ignelater luminosus]|uniref:PiggyBac transposable element-derived protein domain-containing protein n=1 Tax=Ignelater luminosus TaxID=2038154 RepID=A0A8K0GG89_IGNLU|nr:hypothetical protein ILUMI_02677 [Ignelater luminosus]